MRTSSTIIALAVLVLAAWSRPQLAISQDVPAEPGVANAPAEDAAREQTADQQVRHVLNRLTFGPLPGDVERVRKMGVDQWIEWQLNPESIDDRKVERIVAQFPLLKKTSVELARDYPPEGALATQLMRSGRPLTSADSAKLRAAGRESFRVAREMQAARVIRAVASERQLLEVMTDFWLNHFNVHSGKERVRYALPEYERTIRAHALGKFRDLLGAVAKSEAMLQYLDNFQSVADPSRKTLRPQRATLDVTAPDDARGQRGQRGRMGRRGQRGPGDQQPQIRRGLNENYARELLELHTMGVDGGYTQQDVTEVARAFTGWTVRGAPEPPRIRWNLDEGYGFVFRPERHDAEEKVVLGHRLPAGRGIEDGEEVLDILARHPSTARFIATKLARRFVSDSPPLDLVDRAAAKFLETDGDIRETLRTIITSPEFFSSAAYRSKIKTPFELVVSAARILGAPPDTTGRTEKLIADLGQPIFGRATPDGWPDAAEAWINTGAILSRINFGLAAAGGRLPGVSLERVPGLAGLRHRSRQAQVDGVIAAILGGEASPDTREVLLKGENPLLARDDTEEMIIDDTPRRAAPGTRMVAGERRPRRERRNEPLRLDPFAQIVGLALGAPEFQWK